MNINQILNFPAIPSTRTSESPPFQKRKLDTITSDTELMTQSSSSRSRRKLRSYHKSPTALSNVNSSLKADREGCEPKPLSLQDNGRTVHALSSQSYHPAEPATHIRRRDSLTHRSNRVVRIFSSKTKTPLARHWRVLSRHIRRFQNSEAHDGGGGPRPGDFQEMISLTQIPSIMDVYLDAKSPSIDYTEEVFLEIADRSRRLSLLNSGFALASSHSVPYSSHHYRREYRLFDSSDSLSSEVSALNLYRKEQICHGGNDAHLGNSVTRHPDSFVRSTATWSEGLPNEQ